MFNERSSKITIRKPFTGHIERCPVGCCTYAHVSIFLIHNTTLYNHISLIINQLSLGNRPWISGLLSRGGSVLYRGVGLVYIEYIFIKLRTYTPLEWLKNTRRTPHFGLFPTFTICLQSIRFLILRIVSPHHRNKYSEKYHKYGISGIIETV